MTSPHPPAICASTPYVADDEDAAAVLSQHCGLHAYALEDGRGVAVDIDVTFLHLPGVDDVVVEHGKPRMPRHDRRSRLYKDQRIVVVKDAFNRRVVALVDAAIKLDTCRSEVVVGHRAEDDTQPRQRAAVSLNA